MCYNSTTQNLTIYRNAEVVFTYNIARYINSSNLYFALGSNSGTMPTVSFDDFRIYKTNLSGWDVAALYNSGNGTEDQFCPPRPTTTTLDPNHYGRGVIQIMIDPTGDMTLTDSGDGTFNKRLRINTNLYAMQCRGTKITNKASGIYEYINCRAVTLPANVKYITDAATGDISQPLAAGENFISVSPPCKEEPTCP
jgi:hypothetical protein